MKHSIWVKIMVWVLVVLMAGSCAILALQFLFNVDAAEPAPEAPDYVTAGLMYGSDVTVGFETVSTVGFCVSAADIGADEPLTELYTIENKKISVVCDDSLSKSAYTYSVLKGNKDCAIGGYHLEVYENFATLADAEAMLERIRAGLAAEGSDMQPFLAYINGVYKVRLGNFAARPGVAEHAATIPNLKTEITMVAALPSDTGVSVVDPATDEILFEFDDGGKTALALTALPKDGEKQYLRTPAKRLYDGAFVYSRYKTADVDGVQLVNLLPLEDYIAGVVPYEISPTWDYEALRAFAITVRSYTARGRRRHRDYGFDLCNTTHCQVYRGIGSANDNVYAAVAATKGMVLTYEGSIVPAYYSSSTGGYTAGGNDTWGGSEAAYLTPTYTPWERYSEYANGLWSVEVDAAELAEHLRNKGYTALTGQRITDIQINSFSGDGPYVYSITYTDSDGNSQTITRCDKVRTSISKYVNSANFVVGRGSVTRSYEKVVSIRQDSPFSFTTGGYLPLVDAEDAARGAALSVLTGAEKTETEESRLTMLTGSGAATVTAGDARVAIGDSLVYASTTDALGIVLTQVTETLTAKNPQNFIFAGKGWGHGVGISQYGTKDLADAGVPAEQILALYFPKATLCDYRTMQPVDTTAAKAESDAPTSDGASETDDAAETDADADDTETMPAADGETEE